MSNELHEAVLWEPLESPTVCCYLCNFRCRIKDGKKGICQVRQNVDGTLYTLNYHAICTTHVDPIEKKPLFHFQPGSRSFSVATAGCNFQCDFCQNWQISQLPRRQDHLVGDAYEPETIVRAAKQQRCASIAYTYTEPTIFMELASDCGRLARKEGLANVFVSNGYMTIEAIEYARDFLDAINVDLKAFTEEFYRQTCKATLAPVLESLKYIAQKTDIWLEVTTLVVPGMNDSEEELRQIAEFIANELGVQVPWHISRFHPDYQRSDSYGTPAETMTRAYELGREAGLRYVFMGNMPGTGKESTYCHECGQVLIERIGYQMGQYNLLNGACTGCGAAMAGKGLNPIAL